jgi:hypothetical protein
MILPITTLLDQLLTKAIQWNGALMPGRGSLNILGGTVTDNPGNDSTDFTAGGGSRAYGTGAAPPAPTALTWVQQAGLNGGTASAVLGSDGAFTLSSPTPGDNAVALHCLVTAAPTAPYTLTIGVLPDGMNFGSNYHVGLVLRESGTGKLLCFNLSDQDTGIAVSNWTNATTLVGEDYLSSALGGTAISTTQGYNSNAPFVGPIWLRVQNTGTNLFFSRSLSGSFFAPLGVSSSNGYTPMPVSKTNFMAGGPNQVGVGIGNVSGTAPGIGMRVFSWDVSNP